MALNWIVGDDWLRPRVVATTRFDDRQSDADAVPAGGWECTVECGPSCVTVRVHDHEPGAAIIVGPADARSLPEARTIVDLIRARLGVSTVRFFNPSTGDYADVHPGSLEFRSWPEA